MPTPARPVIFSGYEPTSLALMVGCLGRASRAEVLRRASKGTAIDKAALEADLVRVILATGIGREATEAAILWHETKEDGHLVLARQFARMAEAANPLDPGVCTAAVRSELNGMIINRWTVRWRREKRKFPPSLVSIVWDCLTARDQEEIRDMVCTLAAFHKSLAPSRRPKKNMIDTALLLLAEIFASHAGKTDDHNLLPHSEGAQFIKFAGLALRPFFDPTEISALALARRWQRLKDKRSEKKKAADPRSAACDA